MKTWNLDTAHSTIGFKIQHLVVSTLRGSFTDYTGTITTDGDSFENAQVSFTAQAKSIDTGLVMRDDHLRSADFFDVENYPTITFTSTEFKKIDENTYTVTGDLTMKDVTKPVTLTATTHGIGTDLQGRTMIGFEITGSINRQDFGLTWNAAIETGGVAVGDTVKFDMQIEAIAA